MRKIILIGIIPILVLLAFLKYWRAPTNKLHVHCEYDNQYLIALSYTYYYDKNGNEVKHGMLYKRTPSPWGDMYRPLSERWELYDHGMLVERDIPRAHIEIEPFEAFLKKPTACKCEGCECPATKVHPIFQK